MPKVKRPGPSSDENWLNIFSDLDFSLVFLIGFCHNKVLAVFTSCIENSRSSVYCLDLAHYKTWIFYIQYSSTKRNGLATKIEIDDED